MLEDPGYQVLPAGGFDEAFRFTGDHFRIELFITDVAMPGMNGRDLADRIQKKHPGKKVLFMSGYTANVIVKRGVLDANAHFITKPFSKRDLALKIHEELNQKRMQADMD
jgi:DNA-binding NtrC family response regulator